jgi:hypothetical protein
MSTTRRNKNLNALLGIMGAINGKPVKTKGKKGKTVTYPMATDRQLKKIGVIRTHKF